MLSLYILCCGAGWILDVSVLAVSCAVFSFSCHSVCPGAVLENDLLVEHVAWFLSTHCFTTHPCYPPHSLVATAMHVFASAAVSRQVVLGSCRASAERVATCGEASPASPLGWDRAL